MYKKFMACFGICFLMGCSDIETHEQERKLSSGSRIDEKLAEYNSCLSNQDYICATAFMLPSQVRSVGGASNMVRILEQIPQNRASHGLIIDQAKTTYETHGKIITDGDALVSVIPTIQRGAYQGQVAEIHTSLIAFSLDKGKTWFFLEGNDDNQLVIANENPQLLQRIKLPSPVMKIGDATFIQKNDLWVKQNIENRLPDAPKDSKVDETSGMKY